MPKREEPQEETVERPEPRAGQYAMFQPEDGGGEKLPLRERLKDFVALTLAAYSILWKPLVCMILGAILAFLLVSRLLLR